MAISRRTFAKLVGGTTAGSMLAGTASTGAFAQDDRQVLILATNGADITNIDPHYAVTTQDRASPNIARATHFTTCGSCFLNQSIARPPSPPITRPV